MLRVAVLIPCFNDGPLAEQAVASVQEVEEVEVVVIDDGSTEPSTMAALERLHRQGVTVLHQPNGGLSSARRTGAASTSARYVFPLDSDDLLLPGALSRLADALDRTPAAAFAYGDYELFGDYDGFYTSPRTFDPWALSYRNRYPVSSLIRREALEATGMWELRHGYEDWDLWMTFAQAGWDAVHVPGVSYRRRLHGSRMLTGCRANHAELYADICARHHDLIARRRDLRRRSDLSPLAKVLYPVLFGSRRLVPSRIETLLAEAAWRWQQQRRESSTIATS